jgi:hypothetical protein
MTLTTPTAPAAIDAAVTENLEGAPDDLAAEALAAADAVDTEWWVGFVGCERAGLLKVRVNTKPREVMRVHCPTCDAVHLTPKPMLRAPRDGEAEPELVEIPPAPKSKPAPADPTNPAPVDPTKLSGAQKVSDAAIFAGIGTTDAPAAETAEALGFTGAKPTSSLTKRLRRMNERAEKKGEPAPFILTKGGGPKPMTVRRAGSKI